MPDRNGGIGEKVAALGEAVILNRFHQANVALLHEILAQIPGIALREGEHEIEMALDQGIARGHAFRPTHLALIGLQDALAQCCDLFRVQAWQLIDFIRVLSQTERIGGVALHAAFLLLFATPFSLSLEGIYVLISVHIIGLSKAACYNGRRTPLAK